MKKGKEYFPELFANVLLSFLKIIENYRLSDREKEMKLIVSAFILSNFYLFI